MTDTVDHRPSPSATAASGDPTPSQMVDALHVAFGSHHARAVHAKGVMALGSFEPSAEAAGLCSAPLFRGEIVPAVFRFSDFTGIPDIPDTAGGANPRGFAMRLGQPGAGGLDVVAHSFNGFPTATSQGFRELLLAIGASGSAAPRPTALDQFLAKNPVAKTFLTTQKPPPESYLTLGYYGVNAFWMQGPAGVRTAVRYRFLPAQGESLLSAEQLASKDANYLVHELPRRLAGGSVAYHWFAQLAEPGDDLADPSTAWPETRRLVDLGRLTITEIPVDPEALDRETAFMPLNAPAEIAPADPMLILRQQAYPLSFEERQ